MALDGPLSDDEIQALHDFLMDESNSDEAMTFDMMDGFMHALAIGPETVQPAKWLPLIWGTDTPMPPMESLEELNHLLSLVMRHFNSIVTGLQEDPPEVWPYFPILEHEGEDIDEAQGWAIGFVEGVRLSGAAWQSLLDSAEGQRWMQAIRLLGDEDHGDEAFATEQAALDEDAGKRSQLAARIPADVLAMHAHWLPFRKAMAERDSARLMQTTVGRNHPCPCGSGRKFRKCCGAANELH